MADDGLHEIQLNGKQLVFLFMASTVVAVVIFLCGVMVGRGVRAQRPANPIEASADAVTDPTAVIEPSPREPLTASVPSNAPVASQETLTYPGRLEGQDPTEETLRPAPAPSASAPTATASTITASKVTTSKVTASNVTTSNIAEPKAAPARASADASNPGEPAGNGFVVQVAAVNDRREADTIAQRLSAKGYPTFVTTPPNGVPRMFRVRIGKYPTRREAETIAARLEKEDQFKPWITR